MKFEETAKKLLILWDIYGGHVGFNVESICYAQSILVYF